MAVLGESVAGDYSSPDMKAKLADGPWGAAVQYWLDKLRWRQADLSRATGIEAKTISTIVRGYDTTTRMLRKIAHALDREATLRTLPNRITFEDVLVSPERKSALELRKAMIQEITERVAREMDTRGTTPLTHGHPSMPEMIRQVEAYAADPALPHGPTPAVSVVRPRPSSKKMKRPSKK
jgi:transcriptional regulator with XRE-family HTH domain